MLYMKAAKCKSRTFATFDTILDDTDPRKAAKKTQDKPQQDKPQQDKQQQDRQPQKAQKPPKQQSQQGASEPPQNPPSTRRGSQPAATKA